MRLTFVVGRAIFGGFFLYSGIHHFQNVESLAQYAAAKQVNNPTQAVQLSGALLAASGTSFLLGVKPRLGMAGASLFLISTMVKMHDFWNQQDAAQRQNEMVHFLKNLALLGAAMAIGSCESRCEEGGDL